MTGPQFFDFSRLIHPIQPETFRCEYWEKQPLRIARRQPDYYASLLTLADVDQILSASSIRPNDVLLVREGEAIPLTGKPKDQLQSPSVASVEAVYAEYRDGATILLPSLHRSWKPLTRLCQGLADEFSSAFQVNAYLTPPEQKGLHVHYDTHDVFVVQVEGSKHWRLYEAPIVMPLRGQPYRRETAKSVKLVAEFDLHSGDCLYIPRGHVHDAVATDNTSLHLALGVNTITWASVVSSVVESAIERDWRFRESLPIGFATNDRQRKLAETRLRDLFDILNKQIEPAVIINEAVESALSDRPPILDGHLLDLEATARVNLDTRVKKRPEIHWRLAVEGESVSLDFHGKVVRMPAHVQADLMFVAETGEFTARGLPGVLDDSSRLVLIQRLLREGFLTICR